MESAEEILIPVPWGHISGKLIPKLGVSAANNFGFS